MKYLNVVIFILLSLIYLSFSTQIKFSTNFIEIFFSQQSIKLFDIAKKLGSSEEILIAKKGFTKESFTELEKVADELREIPEISKVEVSLKPSNKMKKYFIENYYILSDFDNAQISNEEIKKRLQNIYDKIYSSPIYEPINTYDPLELFTQKIVSNQKRIKLKDYGYVIKAKTSINTSSAAESRVVYNKINLVLEKHKDIVAIAPFYYLVENSAHIRSDAQKIMFISTLFLLILYFFILKNIKLFFNTVITIGSSILCAILLTFAMYESISILALVFGISITTISIDYMFHYYFHGDFSDKKFIVKKRVLFGFITTFGVFVIFSFIDITLFSQLAVFSAVSLSVAYLLFSFVFIHLGISPPKLKRKAQKTLEFKPLHVVLLSLIMLGYVYQNLEFDSNLKNLDYQNKKLINLSKKFNEGLPNNYYQKVIINETTKERLLQRYEELLKMHPTMLGIGKFVYSDKKCNERVEKLKKYDFKKLKDSINKYAQQIGFKNAFSNSYKGIEDIMCNMRVIDDMKFKIIKDDDKFYTIGLINSNKLVEKSLHVEVIDLGKILSNDTKIMKSTLVNYMIISIVFIVIILFFLSGVKILFPLMYLLFPLSLVLFVITLIGQINIMHMFALIILLAISIDYGIYLHNTKTTEQTKTAIKYALLSTICGFGVLIFSSTVALYSIGLVISVGVGAIFLLLYASL